MKAATKHAKILHMTQTISIHAAREGGDDFLAQQDRDKTISIHAAREGGDELVKGMYSALENFNPRRP